MAFHSVDHMCVGSLGLRWTTWVCVGLATAKVMVIILDAVDIVHRAYSSTCISSRLESAGISQLDGKWPDGIAMVPWKHGKLLVWDATCLDTFAPCILRQKASSEVDVRAVAAMAEEKKLAKCSDLEQSHSFIPVAVETSSVLGLKLLAFLLRSWAITLDK